MAVGCLIKGAYAMLPTLCLFLEEDNHYDATRASLMLAATTACMLSIDSEVVSATMGEGYNINVKSSPSGEDLVWLVRCLLQVGVARDSLKDTLMLLNAIVPDELRNRRYGNVLKYSVPSMELCKKLVTLILRSSQPDNHQSTHRNFQASWTEGGMRVGSTSGSLPPVPPNVRSVRGSDVLVDEHCGLVICAIIQECLSLENLSTQFT